MGVSTDAVIFYGYCWDEPTELVTDDGEWATVITRKRGHASPWDNFPKELEDSSHPKYVRDYTARNAAVDKWKEEHRAELDARYKLKRDIEAEFGVELRYHCSGEYSIPYLCVKCVTARRGYPVEIDPGENFRVLPEWADKLNRWLAELGIEKPHSEPKWWLVSYWG